MIIFLPLCERKIFERGRKPFNSDKVTKLMLFPPIQTHVVTGWAEGEWGLYQTADSGPLSCTDYKGACFLLHLPHHCICWIWGWRSPEKETMQVGPWCQRLAMGGSKEVRHHSFPLVKGPLREPWPESFLGFPSLPHCISKGLPILVHPRKSIVLRGEEPSGDPGLKS